MDNQKIWRPGSLLPISIHCTGWREMLIYIHKRYEKCPPKQSSQFQSSKLKFEFTSPNQIIEYILHVNIKIKTEKFTGPNKVLLVLGRRTDANREDCHSPLPRVNLSNYKHQNAHPRQVSNLIMFSLWVNTVILPPKQNCVPFPRLKYIHTSLQHQKQ